MCWFYIGIVQQHLAKWLAAHFPRFLIYFHLFSLRPAAWLEGYKYHSRPISPHPLEGRGMSMYTNFETKLWSSLNIITEDQIWENQMNELEIERI